MAAKKPARKPKSAWMEPLLDLPGDDKRELIKRLVDSLDNEMDPDVEKAWLKECQRRSKAIRKGAKTYSLTEVLEAARAATRRSA